jgi:hypothetical protein
MRLSVHFYTLAEGELFKQRLVQASPALPDSLRRREPALPDEGIARIFQNIRLHDMNRAPRRQGAAAQQGDHEQNHLACGEPFHAGPASPTTTGRFVGQRYRFRLSAFGHKSFWAQAPNQDRPSQDRPSQDRSGDLRGSHRTFGPPRGIRLTRLHRIAFQALETCPPVIGNHGLHAFLAVRAARRVHCQCSISNKTPHWNKGSVAAFTIAF